MTGHLVISTLHTNSAIASVTRLIDMGLPRYLVASVIIGIVAQRLVRKICQRCRVETKASESATLKTLRNADETERVASFIGKGCDSCNYSGFHGRVGIFEILNFDSKVRDAISAGGTEEEIGKASENQGFTKMGDDGLKKVHAGETTLEEILRVIDVQDEMAVLCPSCQKAIHIDFLACPHCKYDIQLSCSACKKHLKPDWIICPFCKHDTQEKPKKGRRAADSKTASTRKAGRRRATDPKPASKSKTKETPESHPKPSVVESN